MYICRSVCLSVCLSVCSASEATNSFAEEQKVSAIRKVYQEACSQPLVEVDTIWKDYQAFEQVCSVATGVQLSLIVTV